MKFSNKSNRDRATSQVHDVVGAVSPTTGNPDFGQSTSGNVTALPASLPKGGGAIQGLGENFDVDLATGSGKLTVPIFTSKSRAGKQPILSLSYSPGYGNGSFGIGWDLSEQRITRKTDKGLPRYRYGRVEDEDIFVMGGEDL